jgi:hypothetical protein
MFRGEWRIKMPALKNPRHEAFAKEVARGMSASAAEENAVLIKKPEKTIKRDEMGRFEQRGTGLIKKSSKKPNKPSHDASGAFVKGHQSPGPGRPPGSKNKTTLALREAILAALDKVGGADYLARLAIENSSAFASLLARVLPHTIGADPESGGGAGIEFTRIIVMPDGHRHIEGKTPLQLPSPTSHTLPIDEPVTVEANYINDLD